MKTIEERAEAFAISISPYPQDKGATFDTDTKRAYIKGATEQEAIYKKRMEELLQYLEELEAHYRVLGHYDDGKPIRRVIEFIKTMEE